MAINKLTKRVDNAVSLIEGDSVGEEALLRLYWYEETDMSPDEVKEMKLGVEKLKNLLNKPAHVIEPTLERLSQIPVGSVVWMENRGELTKPCEPLVRTFRRFGNSELSICDEDILGNKSYGSKYGVNYRFWTKAPDAALKKKTVWVEK